MLLVETEGSYTNKLLLESLDVHVGQSYSVLVTTDQSVADYYMVASPKMIAQTNQRTNMAIGVLHYDNSTTPPNDFLPEGLDPFDVGSSMLQSSLTAGAARHNPQGSFNMHNVTISQYFHLHGGPAAKLDGVLLYTVNNVSYLAPDTPLTLADYALNGSGVYSLHKFPVSHDLPFAVKGANVISGIHKAYVEIFFVNGHQGIDSWHLDGFGFFTVG
ncbi:hypothetical protein ACH5RR_016350 [Cinchona calisaya]|uniref:Plastocyanin-like domain-containing protein n=1 Tax=Cinchona calisaya TaxID=153742 RepID=A0ABD2ZVM3_9GENT